MKKTITFLMSFGHCGIDWLHSLLDSHPQILIMPAFSFYRTWKILDASSIEDVKGMHTLWDNYFINKNTQHNENHFFINNNEQDLFSNQLMNELTNFGISRQDTLWAIIKSYAVAKNIDLNKIKSIIEHEHISFPYKEILKDYNNPKIIMIYRDPHASIAGYYKGIEKKYGNWPDIYEYFFNMSIEEWLNSWDLYKKYKNKHELFLVKNEDLSKNTKKQMQKLAKWLEIDYKDSLTLSTHAGRLPWIADSSYLSKNKKEIKIENDYFDPEKIKQRWSSVLIDKRDLIMIEYLFNDFIEEFGYERLMPNTMLAKLKGIYYFLLPHRGPKRFGRYEVQKNEINRELERLRSSGKNISVFILGSFPQKIQSILIRFKSIIIHIKIIFFPFNRWSRYDSPKTNFLYRNVT